MENNLPLGWIECPLGEVAQWGSGGTPSRKIQSYFGGHIPWIKTGELNDSYIYDTEEHLTEEGVANSSAKIFPKGSVAVAMYGATIGKTAILGIDASSNQACAIAQVNPDILLNKYLFYYLRSQKQAFIDKGQGGAQPNISQQLVKEHTIPLAPLNEQHRIIDKLEKLLQKTEANQQRLEKIPGILKRFRQAVLAAAVSGKLTEDWRKAHPEVESGEKLLKQVQIDRLSNAKTSKQVKDLKDIFYNFEEKGGHLAIPLEWKFVALVKLCEAFNYGTSSKSGTQGHVPVLRMGNIQEGKIDWQDLKYTSDPEEIKKYFLKPGDVLFNRTNSPELVGKTAIYQGDRPAIFAGYLIRISNFFHLDPYYLNFCLNSLYAREWCQKVKTDGVSQSNINAQKLAEFEIPFCSLQEQQEIVHRVEFLLAKASRIEVQYNKAKAYLDKLPQALLAKAFRGELVPQDPNEEPASVLLERIRAEKDGKPKGKKKPVMQGELF